jgi:hypothetical protein
VVILLPTKPPNKLGGLNIYVIRLIERRSLWVLGGKVNGCHKDTKTPRLFNCGLRDIFLGSEKPDFAGYGALRWQRKEFRKNICLTESQR